MDVFSRVLFLTIIVTAVITVIIVIAAVIMAVDWSSVVAFMDLNELECS